MIKISASAIRDYLECPAKVKFRHLVPEQAEQNEKMAIGTVVHKTVELFYNDRDKGFSYALQKAHEMTLNEDKINKCLKNFYNNYSHLLADTDEVEKFFSYPLYKDVNIVGKIDRISNGVIYDWKTGETCPDTLANDIQFIIYFISYIKLYNKEPISSVLVSLNDNKILTYKFNEPYATILMQQIIPTMVDQIKSKNLAKTGLYNRYTCKRCSFRKVCMEETFGR